MKKIFFITLVFILGTTSHVGAQASATQCSPVTADSKSFCCGENYPQNKNACDVYQESTIFGQINSGTISTTAVNQNQGSVTVAAGSPQSGSTGLQTCSAIKFKSLLDILIWVRCVITAAIIPLIFVLAFLFFLWGIFRFMYASDSKDKEESKKFILWGIIGLFVMVTVWGIIKILGNTFGFELGAPYLQTTQSPYLDIKNANKN